MLLGSLGTFAGDPVAPTTLNVKVAITPMFSGIVEFHELGNTRLSEYLSVPIAISRDEPLDSFSRHVDAGKQVVYLNNCPLLVNTGDQATIMLWPSYKNGQLQANAFIPSATGKDAARQVLPFLIDSLYQATDDLTTIDEVNAFIDTRSKKVNEAITRAGVTDPENLAILNAYEQTKLLSLKVAFQASHKDLLPSNVYGDWCLKGFSIGNSGMSGLSNRNAMQQLVGTWWAARKLQDSSLTDDDKLAEIMQHVKSEPLKGSFAADMLQVEGNAHAFTEKFKHIYDLTNGHLSSTTPVKRVIDSLYKVYGQLEPGQPAYNFTLKNDKGDIVRLSDFKGKTVIIDIWATWCSGCVAALPIYNALRDLYKDKSDMVFLTIGWEAPNVKEHWKKFSQSRLIDGEHNLFLSADREDEQCKQFIQRYCLTGITRWIAIDREGKILNGNLGYPAEPGFAKQIASYYKTKN